MALARGRALRRSRLPVRPAGSGSRPRRGPRPSRSSAPASGPARPPIAGEVARRRGAPRPRADRGRDGSRRSAGAAGGRGRQRRRSSRSLELVRSGEHAASDYLEDALTTGVTTIGARRAGGGLAGAPFASNVAEARRACRRSRPRAPRSSRAAVPRCHRSPGTQASSSCRRPARRSTSAATWVRTASCGRTSRWLPWLADRFSGRRTAPTSSRISSVSLGDARVVVTDFRPTPLADVAGRRAFFATTAPPAVAERQVEHLRNRARRRDRRLVGAARRPRRTGEGPGCTPEDYEVLFTELKAAAVDVACGARWRAAPRSCSSTTGRRPMDGDGTWRRRSSEVHRPRDRPRDRPNRRGGRRDERADDADEPDPDLRSRDRACRSPRACSPRRSW